MYYKHPYLMYVIRVPLTTGAKFDTFKLLPFPEDKLTEIYNGQQWKLLFVIVSKRILHYNRSYPPAGTMVDDKIILHEKNYFYTRCASAEYKLRLWTLYRFIC